MGRAATTPAGKAFEPGGSMFFGYGYQTWILPGRERQFLLLGLRRQMILVDPEAKLVMVSTAAENLGGGGRSTREPKRAVTPFHSASCSPQPPPPAVR